MFQNLEQALIIIIEILDPMTECFDRVDIHNTNWDFSEDSKFPTSDWKKTARVLYFLIEQWIQFADKQQATQDKSFLLL